MNIFLNPAMFFGTYEIARIQDCGVALLAIIVGFSLRNVCLSIYMYIQMYVCVQPKGARLYMLEQVMTELTCSVCSCFPGDLSSWPTLTPLSSLHASAGKLPVPSPLSSHTL